MFNVLYPAHVSFYGHKVTLTSIRCCCIKLISYRITIPCHVGKKHYCANIICDCGADVQ